MIGRTIAHYEIVEKLGEGGMGVVYKARDTHLDRSVAIKVLPAEKVADLDRKQRFIREAKTASALNHPNIITVHDIDQADGVDFIAMEYVHGKTLGELTPRRGLRLSEALKYAVQIADALAKAHSAGIIHRDLKPGNVMVAENGLVKVLDFGLAKLTETAPPGEQQATRTIEPRTEEGAILGTTAYMSPEQAEGRKADVRSDIFAFGAVLYEMLTGKRAFEGESPASVVASILRGEPSAITAVQPSTPPALEWVLKKCLAKDPGRRWQSAADLRDELEWIDSAGTPEQARAPAQRWPWMAATAVLAILLGLSVVYFRTTPAPDLPLRLSVSPPERASFTLGENRGGSAISPDGRTLAFVATGAGKTLLWVRPLDSLSARSLPGTEGAYYPFWSPDSRSVGFFANGELKTIDLAGGPPRVVCDAPAGRGGTWNQQGTIVFTPTVGGRLHRVPADGGEVTPITAHDLSRQENAHYFPHFLPDGRRFLYWVRSARWEQSGVYVGTVDAEPEGQRPLRLIQSFSAACYAPGRPGHLLFARGQTLLAQRFDPDRLRLTGDPFPVAEQVGSVADVGLWHFSVSSNKVLVFGGGGDVARRLTWWSREGKPLGVIGEAGAYYAPRFSPDDRRLAVARFDPQAGNADIWTTTFDRGIATRFTFQPEDDLSPIWSPNGEQIVFASGQFGLVNLYQKAASGIANEQRLIQSSNSQDPEDWSEDGRFLLYREESPGTGSDLWVLPMTSGGEARPFILLQTPFDECQGQFSPDGRWIAYCSNESGRREVYVRGFRSTGSAPGGRWQVSSGGGDEPRWRGDGKELFYLTGNGALMAVRVTASAVSFEAGAAQRLFGPVSVSRSPTPGFAYDVTRDGQRFLMVTWDEESSVQSMTVVLNWQAGLKK